MTRRRPEPLANIAASAYRGAGSSNHAGSNAAGTGFGGTDGPPPVTPHEKPDSLWDQTLHDGSMASAVAYREKKHRMFTQAATTAAKIYRDRVDSHSVAKAVVELIQKVDPANKVHRLRMLSLTELIGAATMADVAPDHLEQALAEQPSDEVTPMERFRHAAVAITAVAALMQPDSVPAQQHREEQEQWLMEIRTRFDHEHHIQPRPGGRDGFFAGVGWALDPQCHFKTAWDVTQVFFLIYCAVFVPLRVCWEQIHKPWETEFVADLIVDVFFLLDLLINCITGYVRKDTGKLEYRIRGQDGILRNYFSSWFVVDFVSIIPVNYITLLGSNHQAAAAQGRGSKEASELRALKLLRFLRLIRLMRLVKVKRVMERYESLLGLINTIEFVKLVVMVFFVGHFLCCFWFAVGVDQNEGGVTIAGWRTQNEMQNATMSVQYVTALYWSLTTMTTVGYGDISAYTTMEKIYAVVAMLIGGFAFGLIVGSLTNIISASNPAEALRKARLSEIASWMAARKVPQELRDQVYDYYRNLLLHKVGIDEQGLMRELPHFLAEPLMGRLYEPIMGSPEDPTAGLKCWKQMGLDDLPHQDQVEICTRTSVYIEI